jgi:hypothetical protein
MWACGQIHQQVFFNAVNGIKLGFKAGAWGQGDNNHPQHFTSYRPFYLKYDRYKYQRDTDAAGYPGSAAGYKVALANHLRMSALLHEQDIKDKGWVYTNSSGKQLLLDNVEVMRQALDWADAANKTQNDAILNALINTINTYPGKSQS